jgi:hypothetical protein
VCRHVLLSSVLFDKEIELETPLNVGILREGHMIIIRFHNLKISDYNSRKLRNLKKSNWKLRNYEFEGG